MKLFITGSTGMVGQNLLAHPAIANYEVVAPTSKDLNLLSADDTLAFLRREMPDIVIHCAGVVGGIQANIANPVKFFSDNMLMALNVINGAKTAGVKSLINLGSSCMYPRNATNPLSEDAILNGELEPTNEGYALAKISASRLCDYICRENSGYMYKTIIPCNLYGRFDKFSAHNSHMIPAVISKIDAAVRNKSHTVDIWGDGKARREFMYAGDLADFIFFSMPKLKSMPQVLNVGLGYDYSINEYYEAIAEALGYKGKFVHDLSKPVGMNQKLVDTEKLSTFGWEPKTSLDDGIRKTYQFYLEKHNHG